MTFTFTFEFSNCGLLFKNQRVGPAAQRSEKQRREMKSCMFSGNIFLPLSRCVGVQNPGALHPGANRGHAGGERLLLHGQGPPGEAVLDGEHQSVLLGAFVFTRKQERSRRIILPVPANSKKAKGPPGLRWRMKRSDAEEGKRRGGVEDTRASELPPKVPGPDPKEEPGIPLGFSRGCFRSQQPRQSAL